MTKIKAYFRLMKRKWANSRQIVLMDMEEEDEITEFDLSLYLGWKKKESISTNEIVANFKLTQQQ